MKINEVPDKISGVGMTPTPYLLRKQNASLAPKIATDRSQMLDLIFHLPKLARRFPNNQERIFSTLSELHSYFSSRQGW